MLYLEYSKSYNNDTITKSYLSFLEYYLQDQVDREHHQVRRHLSHLVHLDDQVSQALQNGLCYQEVLKQHQQTRFTASLK